MQWLWLPSILWHVINVLMVVWIVGLYSVPSFVAVGKRKRNARTIVVLNLLLGWTALVGVLALVWALTADVSTQHLAASPEV